MTTRESNKLLAEFLGYTQPHPDYPHTTYWYKKDEAPLVYLSFDTDWNWLMQVVEKIESLGYFFNSAPFIDDESGNLTGEYFCIIQHLTTNLTHCDYFIDVTNCYSKIEATYNACVQFVQWYNKNK